MRYLLIICTMILMASCAKKKPERPEGVLSEQEMVALLQEIYLSESKISKLSLPFDSSKALYQLVEDELFLRNDINDSIYETSMNWYYEHPKELLQVYEVLVDSLMVLEKRHQETIRPGSPGSEPERE